MATRSRTTFKKRQKEMARAEKQREKAAKRMQRKEGIHAPEQEVTLAEAAILRSQGYEGTEDPDLAPPEFLPNTESGQSDAQAKDPTRK
jgi:hypothetical protein